MSGKLLLSVKNLHVNINGNEILKGFDLEINEGEVHVIAGPNGSGKSTLSKVLAGDPHYQVTKGEILFQGKNILGMEPEARALAGIFMAFQYPIEVPGVNNESFLRMAYNAKRKYEGKAEVDPMEFNDFLREKIKLLNIPESFLKRNLNQGFSGGEKKRNEILQMAILEPKLAILDETDSGLDIDVMREVAEGINKLRRSNNAIIWITHHERVLDYFSVTRVHYLDNGNVGFWGDRRSFSALEKVGYDFNALIVGSGNNYTFMPVKGRLK